jgi:hypothetical protein
MRKYVIVGVILMTVVLSYFYFQLGGVSDIEKSVEQVDGYQLVGKSFKGKYNGLGLEAVFFQAKELSDQIVIVNYPMEGDSIEDGFVNQLIGAKVANTPSILPDGFSEVLINSTRVVRATIDAHNLVMPKPNEIEEALREFAKEQNLKLEGYTIEQYLSERELIIEIPIVE